MLPRSRPDRIHVAFDDHRLVANAGLILPATLALRLGWPQLVRMHLDLGDAPGRANTGDKLMTLVTSALACGDCIDDANALRSGSTGRVLGCVVLSLVLLVTGWSSVQNHYPRFRGAPITRPADLQFPSVRWIRV